tara:strand:+ start:8688 stop:9263 length:576 start_codon:yes stop_codon:yes gene_type:complete
MAHKKGHKPDPKEVRQMQARKMVAQERPQMPVIKREWRVSNFARDADEMNAARATAYRKARERATALRRASRIAYLRGIKEKNPELIEKSVQLAAQNTLEGGDVRNVNVRRQQILQREAQDRANAEDLYAASLPPTSYFRPRSSPSPVQTQPTKAEGRQQEHVTQTGTFGVVPTTTESFAFQPWEEFKTLV